MTKSQFIYDTQNYTVRKIPLNIRIDIKKSMVRINQNASIDRDLYLPFDTKMEDIIIIAERYCNDYFRPITKEEVKMNKSKAKNLPKKRV
jgi:CTP:phosphocholine cytidylyltransferase-like protein